MVATNLPILSIKQAFLSALSSESCVIVNATTGSGKSTQLPLWAAELGRILVIQPRRIACTSLASYLASEEGTELGSRIGYAIRFDHQYHADTQIVFATPGVALRWLSESNLASFKTIMLDEFHERRTDTDLILAILKQRNTHRLIVTSATLNSPQLSKYLTATTLEATGKIFAVDIHYRANDPRQMPSKLGLADRVYGAIEHCVRHYAGDILVFLPGKGEITQLFSRIKFDGILVTMLHGGISMTEQQAALADTDLRKIVLTTNVAETSITIPNIKIVIDSGLERRTYQRNGRTVLSLHPISQSSATQRSGRAGRVAEGICCRLWGEHAPLELTTPAQTQREELTELVLAAACAGENSQSLDFIEPLPEKSHTIAFNQLEQINAIDEFGKVTPYGLKIFPLPLDTLFSHLISMLPTPEFKAVMVDLACVLTTDNRLINLPTSQEGLIAFQRWLPVNCDVRTAIKLMAVGPPDEYTGDLTRLREAKNLACQIRTSLGLERVDLTKGFDYEGFIFSVIAANPTLAYLRRSKRREAMGNGFDEVQISDKSRLSDDTEAAVVFDQYSLASSRGTKQTLNIANCLAPVRLKQLLETTLGEHVTTETVMRNGRVYSVCNRTFAGRVIGVAEVRLSGAERIYAMAQVIIGGRLLKGVGEQLQDDLAAWHLYQALNSKGIAPVLEKVDALNWLTQRLTELGVEDEADLALLEKEDLHFSGIDPWLRDDFDSKYPLRLQLNGLLLNVNYMPSRKHILLEPALAKRKEDPRRKELPAWSGWKIQYKKASRVVDIK